LNKHWQRKTLSGETGRIADEGGFAEFTLTLGEGPRERNGSDRFRRGVTTKKENLEERDAEWEAEKGKRAR